MLLPYRRKRANEVPHLANRVRAKAPSVRRNIRRGGCSAQPGSWTVGSCRWRTRVRTQGLPDLHHLTAAGTNEPRRMQG